MYFKKIMHAVYLSAILSAGCGQVSENKPIMTIEEEEETPFTGRISFRSTGWLMTMEQVKKSEPHEPTYITEDVTQKDTQIRYDSYYLNMPAEIIYQFSNNHLLSATYSIKSINLEDSIDKYHLVKEHLIKQYGNNFKERIIDLSIAENDISQLPKPSLVEYLDNENALFNCEWIINEGTELVKIRLMNLLGEASPDIRFGPQLGVPLPLPKLKSP